MVGPDVIKHLHQTCSSMHNSMLHVLRLKLVANNGLRNLDVTALHRLVDLHVEGACVGAMRLAGSVSALELESQRNAPVLDAPAAGMPCCCPATVGAGCVSFGAGHVAMHTRGML